MRKVSCKKVKSNPPRRVLWMN
ncbi:hypothetical protein PQZ65_gp55 [Klebsiella phage 1611E-K2-1]|nr:hypothetical protein PQZ65_gp55 [Klebsiella phage 1611E-K2-1]